jgi:hypothetical protein
MKMWLKTSLDGSTVLSNYRYVTADDDAPKLFHLMK